MYLLDVTIVLHVLVDVVFSGGEGEVAEEEASSVCCIGGGCWGGGGRCGGGEVLGGKCYMGGQVVGGRYGMMHGGRCVVWCDACV